MSATVVTASLLKQISAHDSVNRQIGAAITLVAKVQFPGMPSVRDLVDRLLPPVQLEQIAFLYDETGAPRAFLTWAFVSERTLAKSGPGGPARLELAQWNECVNLCLVDVVAPFGDGFRLVRGARRMFPYDHEYVFYRRYDRGDAGGATALRRMLLRHQR